MTAALDRVLMGEPKTSQRAQVYRDLTALVDEGFAYYKRLSDQQLDDWLFCVALEVGIFKDAQVWQRTIHASGYDYREEQRAKLRVSLLISVSGAQTLQELNAFGDQAEFRLRNCPRCAVKGASGESSKEDPPVEALTFPGAKL